MTARPCPRCGGRAAEELTTVRFRTFDQHDYDPAITLVQCGLCGFAFNEVPDPALLESFYDHDQLFDYCHGGGGEASPLDMEDQRAAYEYVQPHLPSSDPLWVDVACGRGGFLLFLKSVGHRKLMGIDLNRGCVEFLRAQGLAAEIGPVEQLPLADGAASVLSYSHILEHVYSPRKLLAEAKRILAPNGLVYIELPDAGAYSRSESSHAFQWLCREHVNHFDLFQLAALVEENGFEIISAEAAVANRGTVEGIPVLRLLARPSEGSGAKTGALGEPGALAQALRQQIAANVEYLAAPTQELEAAIAAGRSLFCWPMTAAFWYFYGETNLSRANIRALVDRDENFARFTLDGRPVERPDILRQAGPDGTVLIFTSRFRAQLEAYLTEIGFLGQSIIMI